MDPSTEITVLDMAQVLINIKYKEPVSRGRLSEELGIGEGRVRTYLGYLESGEMVQTRKRGMYLTKQGEEFLKDIEAEELVIDLQGLAVDIYNTAVLAKGCAEQVNHGLEQRDAAIKAGSSGATTLVMEKGKLFMPSYPEAVHIKPAIEIYFKKLFQLENADAIVIGSGKEYEQAKRGAIAGMLTINSRFEDVIIGLITE